LFPQKPLSVRRISFTYALMNLVNPFLGGVPTCHGSGGIAGHYTFGARTGGSVVIYGSLYILLGALFSGSFQTAIAIFPQPVLGVILFFEAVALMNLVRDMAASAADFSIVLVVGVIAFGLPFGYVLGLVIGVVLAHVLPRQAGNLSR
jgi:MFS superfamily sulfate permease-like transporter